MNLTNYQPLARRTMKELPTYREHMEHMVLGMVGEVGEIADAIKKFSIYGKGVDPSGALDENGKRKLMLVKDGGVLDTVNLSEEGGDEWWYIVGLLPELLGADKIDVGIAALFDGYVDGYGRGLHWSEGPVKLIAQVNVWVAQAALSLVTDERLPESFALQTLNIVGRAMGLYYRHFDLDLDHSLEINIAKLAKRYGDKFSDVAALNRDTAAERVVLEGGLPPVWEEGQRPNEGGDYKSRNLVGKAKPKA